MRWRIPKYFPGWFVSGGGGGGGAATVQTDGVTLQGDGSAGNKIRILQVETQARLTGAGTVASKLDIAGWPLTFFPSPYVNVTPLTPVANNTRVGGFALPYALIFSTISVAIGTADAVNLYDIGIYNQAGTLIADIGPQTLPNTGIQSFATVQGAQTIAPGLYLFAFTGNSATAAIDFDNSTRTCPFANQSYGVTVGGQLAAAVAAWTVAPTSNGWVFTLS